MDKAIGSLMFAFKLIGPELSIQFQVAGYIKSGRWGRGQLGRCFGSIFYKNSWELWS